MLWGCGCTVRRSKNERFSVIGNADAERWKDECVREVLLEEREQLLVDEQLVVARLTPHVMRRQIAEPIDHVELSRGK